MNKPLIVNQILQHPLIQIQSINKAGDNILHFIISAINDNRESKDVTYSMLRAMFSSVKSREICQLINLENLNVCCLILSSFLYMFIVMIVV